MKGTKAIVLALLFASTTRAMKLHDRPSVDDFLQESNQLGVSAMSEAGVDLSTDAFVDSSV